MRPIREVAALGVMVLLALCVMSIASGAPGAAKQRIAIDAKGNIQTGKTTFVLSTPSPGALKDDVGSGTGTGSPKPAVLKANGHSLTRVTGTDSLTGRNGSFELFEKVESYSAGNGYSADHGVWTFKGVSGAYAGYSGGGGLALVSTPAGRVIFRLEGYVSKR